MKDQQEHTFFGGTEIKRNPYKLYVWPAECGRLMAVSDSLQNAKRMLRIKAKSNQWPQEKMKVLNAMLDKHTPDVCEPNEPIAYIFNSDA